MLMEQGADTVGADFGGRMQPAEGAHAGKVRRQDVLKEARHEIQGLKPGRGEVAGFAVAIIPAQFAFRQLFKEAVGGGGFEDVPGKVTQSVFTGTGSLSADIPREFPDFGRNLGEEFRMFFLQILFEEGAAMDAQSLVVEQELITSRDPAATIGAESTAGDEVMNVRMEDEGA